MDRQMTRRCHACGGETVDDVRPAPVEYQGETEVAQLPGRYCLVCGDSLHSFADMSAAGSTDDALHRIQARIAARTQEGKEHE